MFRGGVDDGSGCGVCQVGQNSLVAEGGSARRSGLVVLVTEMMGAPLTQNHGAPLRIHMPTKYGYKQIKRVGLIAYTNEKPDDYWTELGYDWYAGL